jgi:hypothetical protein
MLSRATCSCTTCESPSFHCPAVLSSDKGGPSSRFALAARVEGFCSSDIYEPSKGRTMVLLSAFINFVKFTEQLCEPFVKDLRERSAGVIAERDQVVAQLEEIQKRIETMKCVRSPYIYRPSY